MSTTFSDWGAVDWSESIDAAEEVISEWMALAVSENGWPQGAADAIVDGANGVQQSIWPWWSDAWYALDIALGRVVEPATEFWTLVYQNMPTWVEEAGYNTDDLDNWSNWEAAVYSAAETAGTTAAAREEGSAATVFAGALDDPDVAIDWAEVAEKALWWGGYGAAGGGVLGYATATTPAKRVKGALDGAGGYGVLSALVGAFMNYQAQVKEQTEAASS